MPCTCVVADYLGCGTDDAQYVAEVGMLRQILLLNRSEGLGRGCIAGQYHEMAVHCKKLFNTFLRIRIHRFERSRAIRHPCIVTQVYVIIHRQFSHDFTEYREAAVTRIKYSYWSHVRY